MINFEITAYTFTRSLHLIPPFMMHSSSCWASFSLLQKGLLLFFKKNGPIPASFSVYFRLFNMLQFKLKKRRWCAWDSNPGRQDGRRKRIHWAMAAPLKRLFFDIYGHQIACFISINRITVIKLTLTWERS